MNRTQLAALDQVARDTKADNDNDPQVPYSLRDAIGAMRDVPDEVAFSLAHLLITKEDVIAWCDDILNKGTTPRS